MRASKRRRNQHEPVRPLARLDFAEIEHRLLGEGTGIEFKTAHYGDVFKAERFLPPARSLAIGTYHPLMTVTGRILEDYGTLSDGTKWWLDDPHAP